MRRDRFAAIVVALVALVSASPARAASVPRTTGIEFGLSRGGFPKWEYQETYQDGSTSQYHNFQTGVFGASLGVFPVPWLGLKAAGETTGPRIFDEDTGYDVLSGALEARPFRYGPFTAFGTLGGGHLSHTYARFNYWSIGGGLRGRIAGPLSFSYEMDSVHSTSVSSKWDGGRLSMNLDDWSWRFGIDVRLVSFGR